MLKQQSKRYRLGAIDVRTREQGHGHVQTHRKTWVLSKGRAEHGRAELDEDADEDKHVETTGNVPGDIWNQRSIGHSSSPRKAPNGPSNDKWLATEPQIEGPPAGCIGHSNIRHAPQFETSPYTLAKCGLHKLGVCIQTSVWTNSSKKVSKPQRLPRNQC